MRWSLCAASILSNSFTRTFFCSSIVMDITHSGDLQPPPKVLFSVQGHAGRTDDLVVAGTAINKKAVIYYCGDIQDLEHNMVTNGCVRYSSWSLERTVRVMQQKFPLHLVIAVRPSRKQDLVFSCFDNFVRSTPENFPSEFDRNYGGLNHLSCLLVSLASILGIETPFEELQVAGFSKGSVVLNQILYEASEIMKNPAASSSAADLFGRIRGMYWLDPGHSTPVNFWVTEADVLKLLARHEISVHVFSTLYQLQRDSRPEYITQMNIFCGTCAKLGVLKQKMCLFDQKNSIDVHFRVLAEFTPGNY